MAKIKLISDLAIGEGDKLKADGLGFKSYAKVLGDSAAGTPGPFTIGIFGEWGLGKTSLLKMVDQYLCNEYQKEIVTVWFNAWQFEQEEHPIVPLIATIIDELEKHESFKAKLIKGGRELINALRATAYGFSAKAKFGVPGVTEFEASLVPKDIIERKEKLSKDPLLDRSLYYDAFEALSKANLSPKIKIVVLVDDLDRCFPDRAIKLLESIKLVLSQAGFIFILAVARKVIEGYLKHRYEKDYGISDLEGQAYLDKIVQLPFPIPPHIGRMEDFSKTLLDQFKAKEKKTLGEIIPIIGSISGNNPRSIIRFINNLIIDKEIFKLMPDVDDVDVSPVHFAITRSLQQWWGDIFELFISSPDFCNLVAGWSDFEKLKRASLEENDESDKRAKLFVDDDNLTKLLFSPFGMEWLQKEKLRVAVTEFLSSQRMDDVSPLPDIDNKLYISATKTDVIIADKISAALKLHNIRSVWFAYPPKGDINNLIGAQDAAIDSCNAILFLLSENDSDKRLQLKAMHQAIVRHEEDDNLIIFYALLPGCKKESIPETLLGFPFIKLQHGNIDDKSLSLLISRLKMPG